MSSEDIASYVAAAVCGWVWAANSQVLLDWLRCGSDFYADLGKQRRLRGRGRTGEANEFYVPEDGGSRASPSSVHKPTPASGASAPFSGEVAQMGGGGDASTRGAVGRGGRSRSGGARGG
jgi:hypothetical protein